MSKLFVAISLPATAIVELVRIQPPAMAGLRIVKADQMHLTLQFIGEADVDVTVDALKSVAGPGFAIQIAGVGRFPAGGHPTTLWAGIQNTTQLADLHLATGNALAKTGFFQPETRPFTPHITLARCGRKVPERIVDEFLTRNEEFSLPSFEVTGFALYSSTIVDDGPVYRQEHWFPLDLQCESQFVWS